MRTVLLPIFLQRTVETGRQPVATMNDRFAAPNQLAGTSALSSIAEWLLQAEAV